MIAVLFLLIALALLGLPLFIALAAGGLYASIESGLDPSGLIIELYRFANQPNLITIPLFTFAGMTMAAGGSPTRLIKLFNALLGWMPGGLAMAAIVSCAFFTAFTGASGVTIIALGGLLYPLFIKSNYSEKFSLGLLTSSGSLGLLFPPSLAILFYGIVSGTNIDELFLVGVVLGLILLILFFLYSYKSSLVWHTPSHPFSFETLLSAARESICDILLPVLVMIGIFGGYVTVSEAAAVTATYALFIESIIYKEIKLKTDLPVILLDTAKLVGSILIILGVAMGLTNILIDSQLPSRLLGFTENYIHSQLQFLLALNIFLLLIGAMMDIFSAIVVVVPLIMPLANRYQVDPVHLGIIFLANLEIGYMTPPVGINLFIASQRFGKSILTLFQSAIPFLVIMLVWLLMISYIPSLTLWWK